MYDMHAMFSRISQGKQRNLLEFEFGSLIEGTSCCWESFLKSQSSPYRVGHSPWLKLSFWSPNNLGWRKINPICPLIDIWFIVTCITNPWDPWNGLVLMQDVCNGMMVWCYDKAHHKYSQKANMIRHTSHTRQPLEFRPAWSLGTTLFPFQLVKTCPRK